MPLVLSQDAEHVVVGHTVEPRARIVGYAVRHPRRQRRQERGLDGILHLFEVVKADPADEYRYQPSVLVPEVVFHQTRR